MRALAPDGPRRLAFRMKILSPVVAPARRALLAAALTAAALGVPRDAHAVAAPTIVTQLDYAAAPGCPGADSFQAVVTRRLGYDAFRADAAATVLVRIESTGRALEGRLEWRDRDGTPIGDQLFPSRSGDCAELARAMGFALALQIQLMATSAGEPRPEPPPPPPVTPAAPPVKPPERAPPPAVALAPTVERRGPSLQLGVGASAGLGLSSGPVALGRLFAIASWSRVAIEAAGEVSVPSTTRRADGAGFSQEQFVASLAGCGVRPPWSLCAVGKLGALRVTGQAVDVPLTASGLLAQTGLRLAWAHELGHRASIVAAAEGLVRLTQGTVTLDEFPVWTSPRFAALLGIGLAVRFR